LNKAKNMCLLRPFGYAQGDVSGHAEHSEASVLTEALRLCSE